MSSSALEATFIEGQRGPLFVLVRKPPGPLRGAVLLVAPFAEEMNKARMMFTDLSEALLKRGVATVLPDLYGTGDSAGEFRDADWHLWQDDLVRTAKWAKSRNLQMRTMLCLRLGCPLGAAAALHMNASIRRTVFWQPVVDGERYMTQFLRLRVAASLMADRRETVADLRARLHSGMVTEIAGYEISGKLLQQIEAIRLAELMTDRLGELFWIDVARTAESSAINQARSELQESTQKLRRFVHQGLVAEPFWSSTEIVRVPRLVELSADVLSEAA